MHARLRLLQVAANLEVFGPNSWSDEAVRHSTQPYCAAGLAAPKLPDCWISWNTNISSCDRPLNLARSAAVTRRVRAATQDKRKARLAHFTSSSGLTNLNTGVTDATDAPPAPAL